MQERHRVVKQNEKKNENSNKTLARRNQGMRSIAKQFELNSKVTSFFSCYVPNQVNAV